MAVSGFGVSALSFATVWATPSGGSIAPRTPADVAPAATAYFGVSAALTAAAVGGYIALGFLPYWRHHSASSLAGTCCSHSAHVCAPQLLDARKQSARAPGRQRGTASEPASCRASAEGKLLGRSHEASHAGTVPSYTGEAYRSCESEAAAGSDMDMLRGSEQAGPSSDMGALELVWLLRGHRHATAYCLVRAVWADELKSHCIPIPCVTLNAAQRRAGGHVRSNTHGVPRRDCCHVLVAISHRQAALRSAPTSWAPVWCAPYILPAECRSPPCNLAI